MFVSILSLCDCFVPAHVFGWCELCVGFAPLCDRFGCDRGDSSASCVAPKTQEEASGVKFASASNLCGPAGQWILLCVHHGSCLLEPRRKVENASAGLGVGPNVGIVEVALRQNCAAPVGHW